MHCAPLPLHQKDIYNADIGRNIICIIIIEPAGVADKNLNVTYNITSDLANLHNKFTIVLKMIICAQSVCTVNCKYLQIEIDAIAAGV